MPPHRLLHLAPLYPLDPSSLPSPHNAATADASTQLSISEFLRLCFTKHPSRRTVPLQFHEDLSDANCPSNSGNPTDVTFTDAATQLSFAEFFQQCILFKVSHFLNGGTSIPSNSLSNSSGNSGPTPAPRTHCSQASPPPPGLESQAPSDVPNHSPTKASPVGPHSHHGFTSTSPSTQPPPTPPTLQPHVRTTLRETTPQSPYSCPLKKCQYRPCGNPLCHRRRCACWSWSISEA